MVIIGLVVFNKFVKLIKETNNVHQQRSMAIGHLNDSGDLKSVENQMEKYSTQNHINLVKITQLTICTHTSLNLAYQISAF